MQLTRTDDHAVDIDALAKRYGGRVGLDAVLDDLDRRLRRTVAPCLSRHRAWTWDAADRQDRGWWPQGVSPGPEPDVLGVTWYAKRGGSRLSVLDLGTRRYRHVALVRPSVDDPDGFVPLRVHAGGLAWSGSTLHVAATRAGLWVCDVGDVLRTEAGYVLPVRHRLAIEEPDGEPLRFSFVSNVPGPTGELVVGEYGNRRQTHRLAQLSADGGPVELLDSGILRAQGVVRIDDAYALTASHGPWTPGSLWTGRPGALRERRWALPMGPEDLAVSADGRRLWTVTEHPRRRWILSLPTPEFR